MTYKGYCQPADVANLLGLTFTSGQTTEAATLIAYAESYIDRETRRNDGAGWLVAPITGEIYPLSSSTIYLRKRPVTSVQQVQVRTDQVGDTLLVLTAGTDYEFFDPLSGRINFVWGYKGRHNYAYIDYTPNLGTVPADIATAAAMIVASTMQYQIQQAAYGTDQVQMGRETGLKFADEAVRLLIPQTAADIIAGYRLPLFA